ncbi:MAG: DUF973 family protein [Gammaproteobacteria bacterium]|nr:DUF973 family protein [Gammaproteobacteria bacterium]
MKKSWSDLGLWLTGLAVMVIGAACPIYLFNSEGTESLFGNIVYVLAGILLFLAGLGIVVFRTWLAENPPRRPEPESTQAARADS